MAEFIKEWGPAILAAAVFVILIAIVQSDAVKNIVSNGLTTMLTDFSNAAKLG